MTLLALKCLSLFKWSDIEFCEGKFNARRVSGMIVIEGARVRIVRKWSGQRSALT
jgi:hypothetical protein